jgi:ribosomal-protein-alanine N-acetyltransferase
MRLILSVLLTIIATQTIQTFTNTEHTTSMQSFFKHFQPIETEHLIIRKLALTDAMDCFAITSDPRVLKMMVALPIHKTLQETEQYLADVIAQYEQDKNEWWAVVEKASNKVIGFCGFVEYKPRFRRVELGYMFAYDSWG